MTKKEVQFVATVWAYYAQGGRTHLPWRKTKKPYDILVSEVMLQQTQVDRVAPKFHLFLKLFPNVTALANAPLGRVLRAWQGLGYNRRAKMLHQCAKQIVEKYNGVFPKTYEGLVALPGIGPYTAGAVVAFAYNEAVPIIETNIRTVYLHHFFFDATDVDDREIVRCIVRTLDTKKPRAWYYALMDYGAYLKKTLGNQNTRSKHYTKQSKFEGSDRQIRGAILRILTEHKKTRMQFHSDLKQFEDVRIDAQLEKLEREGIIVKKRMSYSLPD